MLDTIQYIQELINNDTFYWFCALVGSGMFAIQFVLNFVGLGGDSHDMTEGGWGQALELKWISKQALTGFLMMFGWTALTCRKEFDMHGPWVIVVALLVGLLAFIATGLIFRIAQSLTSTGTVFNIEAAIGKEAVVYQRIPKGGVGKISISIDDITREIDAMEHQHNTVDSFARVQVLSKADSNTVVVKKI